MRKYGPNELVKFVVFPLYCVAIAYLSHSTSELLQKDQVKRINITTRIISKDSGIKQISEPNSIPDTAGLSKLIDSN